MIIGPIIAVLTAILPTLGGFAGGGLIALIESIFAGGKGIGVAVKVAPRVVRIGRKLYDMVDGDDDSKKPIPTPQSSSPSPASSQAAPSSGLFNKR